MIIPVENFRMDLKIISRMESKFKSLTFVESETINDTKTMFSRNDKRI